MASTVSNTHVRVSTDGNSKVGKELTSQSTDLKQSLRGSSYDSPSRQDRRHLGFLESEEPEMVIPEGVEIKGEIEYDKYLYVDGSFEGDILTGRCYYINVKCVAFIEFLHSFLLCCILPSLHHHTFYYRPWKFICGSKWDNDQQFESHGSSSD